MREGKIVPCEDGWLLECEGAYLSTGRGYSRRRAWSRQTWQAHRFPTEDAALKAAKESKVRIPG